MMIKSTEQKLTTRKASTMGKVLAMTVRTEVVERANQQRQQANTAKLVQDMRADLTSSPWKRIAKALKG